MTNGGTNFRGELLLVQSGRGNLPPNVARVNPDSPFNSTVILDNFFGRQFNSLNDVKIHPKSGKIFFTDVTLVDFLAFNSKLICINIELMFFSLLSLFLFPHFSSFRRYGFLNHFRFNPQLPNQVYRFDPDTGALRVVADGFDRCNGIAFSPDGNTAFV